ncbi:polymeric immunoglobulin receptor-like isoform X3 [Anas acuta]|uniref:polymeric immunoglobulin receptor-like isoform X3 n=1 Tax=Anas acuta TaxID=28680 RepID=UPI0035C8B590
MALALALLPLLLLPWGAGTIGRPQIRVVLVTEGEPVVMECPFREHNVSGDYFDEFVWSHRNISRRILQFRMTRPNASCVHRSEGHFSGTVDYERSVSFLNISEVLMNDTGPYHCYVKIGNSNPTEKVTHLLVRGRQPWAASGGLSFSEPPGGEVTLDCDFPAKLPGRFTYLFWLHEQDQSPPRLVAWHLTSSFQNNSGSTGSRFQSVFDLENHRSHLTITGLEEKDSGWYQCEGLGELSGWQRGTRTHLTVQGSSAVLLVVLGSVAFVVMALCSYFLSGAAPAELCPLCSASDKHHKKLRRQRTMQDASDPCHRPAEDSTRQPTGGEAVSASAGSTAEYSLLTFPGRNTAAGDWGQ